MFTNAVAKGFVMHGEKQLPFSCSPHLADDEVFSVLGSVQLGEIVDIITKKECKCPFCKKKRKNTLMAEQSLQLWHLFAAVLGILVPVGGALLKLAFGIGQMRADHEARITGLENRMRDHRASTLRVFEKLEELKEDHAMMDGKVDTILHLLNGKKEK